jgi:hypothetical protein
MIRIYRIGTGVQNPGEAVCKGLKWPYIKGLEKVAS